MKIITIIGARPQFVKAAVVSKELKTNNIREVIIHTGQHYDYLMSEIFFKELSLAKPKYNLNIGSGSHGEQTGKFLIELDKIILTEKPDALMVYGDTNSTLAGALTAGKMQIPLIHIESGLRSFNRTMPEEINRIVTDHISKLLFCPTQTAIDNLRKEGITSGVYLVGDVMFDAVNQFHKIANSKSKILQQLDIINQKYCYLSIHRPYNTDDPEVLKVILKAIGDSDKLVIFPVHPRTKNVIKQNRIGLSKSIRMIEPLSYFDNLILMSKAEIILTDSGGIQKEAYFLDKPCITLRPETEWVETVKVGWNKVVGSNPTLIKRYMSSYNIPQTHPFLFGNGKAAKNIVSNILKNIK